MLAFISSIVLFTPSPEEEKLDDKIPIYRNLYREKRFEISMAEAKR